MSMKFAQVNARKRLNLQTLRMHRDAVHDPRTKRIKKSKPVVIQPDEVIARLKARKISNK